MNLRVLYQNYEDYWPGFSPVLVYILSTYTISSLLWTHYDISRPEPDIPRPSSPRGLLHPATLDERGVKTDSRSGRRRKYSNPSNEIVVTTEYQFIVSINNNSYKIVLHRQILTYLKSTVSSIVGFKSLSITKR